MARVETIVVGGGIAAGTPFTLNRFTYVSQAQPPQIATSLQMVEVLSGNPGIVISSDGTDPLSGSASILRMKGGVVSEHASYTSSVVIGQAQTVTGLYANGFVLLGRNITLTSPSGANNSEPVLVGNDISLVGSSTAGGGGCVVVGSNAALTGGSIANSTYVGNDITDGSGTSNVAIGAGVNLGTAQQSIAIGQGCVYTGSGSSNVIIGQGATKASGVASGTAVGFSTSIAAGGSFSTVIGANTSSGAADCTICGESSTTTHADCILLGSGLASFQTNTAIIGQNRSSQVLNTVVLGSINATANMGNLTLRLSNQSGTNKAAPNFTIQAGLGTGTGTVSQISLVTSVAVGSGVSAHTTQERLRVDGTVTAGQTALMLWDVDNATLERVTVGAADSGGVGFKVLRIPN